MWGYMSGYGWGGMGFGMLAFWVFLGLVLALLVRYFIGNGTGRQKSALDILNERYARGEIGREEFEQMKRDLET